MDHYPDESGDRGRLSFLSRIQGSAFELRMIIVTPGQARSSPSTALSCRDVGGVELGSGVPAHCGGMTTMPEVLTFPSADGDLVLRVAMAAF